MEAKRITTTGERSTPLVADTGNKPPVPPADDPFFYGWRYVCRVSANGTEEWDQVPLTLEDILHPEEEDFRVLSDFHNDDCAYLKYVIKRRLPPDGVVLSDCRVNWGVKGLRAHGPDIAAFLGVRRRTNWRTFYVAREKARALFTIEVTSPSTRSTDLVNKVDHYYRAGVPYYFIVDAYGSDEENRVLALIGYKRGPNGYVRIKPDAQGRFLIKSVGLLLGTEGGRVCGYDAETGEKIGDYQAVVEARAEAESQAETAKKQAQKEREARKTAEERARQLEEELRRLRGEA